MKLLHLADLHLGRRTNGFDFLPDQRYILEQLLMLCQEQDVDAVLLAGDVYDSGAPRAAACELLDWFLDELTARHVAVLGVAGQSDAGGCLGFAARQLARQGVYLAARLEGAPSVVTLRDHFGPVEFVLLPYARPEEAARLPELKTLADDPAPTQDAAVGAALDAAARTPGRRVLVTHQLVQAGGALPSASGSESRPARLADAVDADRLTEFAYAALGGAHAPQSMGADTVRYAGAPLCYDPAECGAQRSAVLVTLGRRGADEIRTLPLAPRRPMRRVTGTLSKLTSAKKSGDLIWATLTDPAPKPGAAAALRAVYPNLLRVDAAPADKPEPRPAPARPRPFEELFAAFFEQTNGRAPTEAETAAMQDLREEADL